MNKNENLIEKGTFKGQVICSGITESHCGFFKIGTLVFCSEFIVFLVKIEMEKNIYLKKYQTNI